MTDIFREFLKSLPIRGGYCLDCLSKMYGTSAPIVAGYLVESGISGRQDTCANCDERVETFRADGP
jgi:hypothetical protein